MHFPLFPIPPFPKNVSDSVENFPNFTFSTKILRLSSAKISDNFFLSSTTNSEFPPIYIFSLFQYISTISQKLLFSPYFSKFLSRFCRIYVLFTYFICFSFLPSLTMMHLCITQCTYWTPLGKRNKKNNGIQNLYIVLHAGTYVDC